MRYRLIVNDPAALEGVSVKFKPMDAIGVVNVEFRDTYFDTDNFDLFKHGYELSKRQGYPRNHYKLTRNGRVIVHQDEVGKVSDLYSCFFDFPEVAESDVEERVNSVTKREIIGNGKQVCLDSVVMEGDDCLAFAALEIRGDFTVGDASEIFKQYQNLEEDIAGVETSHLSNLGLYLKNKK